MSISLKKEQVTQNLTDSIIELIRLIESGPDSLTPERLVEYINRSGICEEDILRWQDFSHPINDSYGRKLIYEGHHFEIMVMSWVSGDYSAIHDHGGAQWGAVKYFGPADHSTFRFDQGILKVKAVETTQYGQINIVDHDLVHLMGNPTPEPFITLHVYGTNQDINPVTLDSRVFDFYHGETQYTDGGMFFLLPDNTIKRREPLLNAEPSVIQKHHFEMLRRAHRILCSQKSDKQQSTIKKVAADLEKHLFCETDIRHLHGELGQFYKNFSNSEWSRLWNDMIGLVRPTA